MHPHDGPHSTSGSSPAQTAVHSSPPQSTSVFEHTPGLAVHDTEQVPELLHCTSTPEHAEDPLHSTAQPK